MPIFEYRCDDCGHEFEKLVRASMGPIDCPKCASVRLTKKLSAFAAVTGASQGGGMAPAPCGTCGNPGGPGSCALPAH
jgi:putative FmdB family regulatory protein